MGWIKPNCAACLAGVLVAEIHFVATSGTDPFPRPSQVRLIHPLNAYLSLRHIAYPNGMEIVLFMSGEWMLFALLLVVLF